MASVNVTDPTIQASATANIPKKWRARPLVWNISLGWRSRWFWNLQPLSFINSVSPLKHVCGNGNELLWC